MCDTIYRQDAIDAVDVKCLHRGIVKGLQEIIEDLPSAQPETHDKRTETHDKRTETHDKRTETHDKRTEPHDKRTETHACDLINRQQAIDAVNRINRTDNWKTAMIWALTSLPSAQPETPCYLDSPCEYQNKDIKLSSAQPQWIPCSERLPEEETYVLVTASNGAVTEAKYWHKEGIWAKGLSIVSVTAWMPLPKPYGGESDE